MGDLAPWARNPRRMTDAARSGLEAAISRWGDLGGITWNKRTGTLVCGHQRVKALQALGGEFISDAAGPAILVMVGGEPSRFPVRVVDMDEAEAAAANVAANNQHIQGDFDESLDSLLAETLALLGDSDYRGMRFPELASPLPPPADEVNFDNDDLDASKQKTCVCPECGASFEL